MESFLNVQGEELIEACKGAMLAFTDRAISYRETRASII
jgi:hypothetical protein